MNFTDKHDLYLGISEKKDGPMKNSLENRLLFLKDNKLVNKIIVSAGLVHKNKVVIVDDIKENRVISNCDALITNQSKYLLTITVADCLPIYFFDQRKKVVALVHAGWRGVVSKITAEVINVFKSHYGSNLNDIEIFIGPHIKDCHFEVKADVCKQFESSDCATRDKKTYVNLSNVVKNQLLRLNIKNDNISISDECTYCLKDKYFSYRRDNPKQLETMLAYIGLKLTY